MDAMNEFRTPIPFEVDGKGPALAIGSMIEAGKLDFVVIAKSDGAITLEGLSRLRGRGVFVEGQS
jgi:hypothetical protein